jgi:hypothetical protein
LFNFFLLYHTHADNVSKEAELIISHDDFKIVLYPCNTGFSVVHYGKYSRLPGETHYMFEGRHTVNDVLEELGLYNV